MVISGKDLAQSLKAKMAEQVATFPAKYGRVPHLVVILVGEDPGSVSYVTGKARAAEEVGIRNTTIRRNAEIGEGELLEIIAQLNADPDVDGILVQLPLPRHIDEDRVIAAIDKGKDVDGFHPLNVAALWQKQPCTLPCTPKGIIRLLEGAGVEIAGRKAVVIGHPRPRARSAAGDARGRNPRRGRRTAPVCDGRYGGRGGRGDRRGGQSRSRHGQALRRRGLRCRRAESLGDYQGAGRRRADDDLLPDGEYDRGLSAQSGTVRSGGGLMTICCETAGDGPIRCAYL